MAVEKKLIYPGVDLASPPSIDIMFVKSNGKVVFEDYKGFQLTYQNYDQATKAIEHSFKYIANKGILDAEVNIISEGIDNAAIASIKNHGKDFGYIPKIINSPATGSPDRISIIPIPISQYTPEVLTNEGKDFSTNNTNLSLAGYVDTTFSDVLVNSSSEGVVYNQTDGTWEYTTTLDDSLISKLNDGVDFIFEIIATTDSGVQSNTKKMTVTLDTIKPYVNSVLQTTSDNVAKRVLLATNENDANIYYTTDGSNPTTNSKKYTGVIELLKTTNLRYFAIDAVGNQSDVGGIQLNINTEPVQLPSKWRMFAVNCEITDLLTFNGADIRRYNHSTGLYESVTDKLVPGEGYWVKSLTDLELDLPIGDFDSTQSVAYNQGFGLVSGYFLKYGDQLKFNDGTTTKNLAEAISSGWIKYMAYYYDNDTYNNLDLRNISQNDVLGRSFWLRFYKPLTISFDGLWQSPPQQLTQEIPQI